MNINEAGFQNVMSEKVRHVETEIETTQGTKHALVIRLEGNSPGVQGISGNLTIEDFELFHDALIFDELVGKNLSDLDDNIESVIDTGEELVFHFMGGGSLTLNGVSGYNDFTSLSIDCYVEIIS